ncbi:MAG: hypothetical protein ISP45_21815 [Reyranella sp.]|nr:hypothetical protein [Reyranella sp.]
MPVQWTVSHPNRLVTAVAAGDLRLADIEAYFDGMLREGLQAYRKLFDVSRATPNLSDDDLMALGARIRAYIAFGPIGPVAIVATTEKSYGDATVFAALASAERSLEIFRDARLAQQWLEAQPTP